MTASKKNNTWAYIGVALIIGAAIIYFLFLSHQSGYVKVKYRDDEVNISASNFESLNNFDPTVKGVWYDSSNEYMVIKLGATYYHYCGMPSSAWNDFKSTSSLYDYYQDRIKGNFDCRINFTPRYK